MATAPTTNDPPEVYNLDVVYVNDKICRYAGEVIKSVSSGLAFTNEFDMARMLQYLDDIDAAVNYIIGQPQLDLPESHPLLQRIQPFPEVPDMESDELDHVVRLLRAGRVEIVNSQSARMGAGFLIFDAKRITSLVAKTRTWLKDYVAARSPMDLPETSPQQLMTGVGKGGV